MPEHRRNAEGAGPASGAEQITAAVGAVAGELHGSDEPPDYVVPLAPQHPSAHGALRIRLTLDGDRIGTAEPLVGYLHRGAEKLFEARDYRQIVVLANRHDWLSAFASELGVVLAVERMTGVAVPERAVWIRMLLAELNRALSHLAFLAAFPYDDSDAFFAEVQVERERLLAVMEEASGGRVHFMYNRVGGLKEDLPAGWRDHARTAVAAARAGIIGSLPDRLARAAERWPGIGVLARADAASYGVSGPIARASGVDLDLRRDDPYLAYAALDVPLVVRQTGDVPARLECLYDETLASLDLADACLDRLADLAPGPVVARLPKTVRAPEGATYAWTENPLGVNGYFVVSRGERTPWRCKLRTASFANVQALRSVLASTRVADLPAILGSMPFVAGDLDK